ncbi:MAG: serine hydrolase domain-containing protein [Pseudomonadota bacterium]
MLRVLRVSTLLFLSCFGAIAVAGTAVVEDIGELEAFMDGTVDTLMKYYNSASGVVTIVQGDEVIFAKGYGYKDVDERIAVDPATTLFRIGSTSKLFTWLSVMQLVEQGKLDLDTDVNQYLQNFQIEDSYDAAVTLRHLLTHTAGFEEGFLGYLIIKDPERILPLSEAMDRYQPDRVNPPGKQISYSNYATALAGLIVEQVSGQPFNNYVQDNILDVLGMNNSTFLEPLPTELKDQMAGGYLPEAGQYVAHPFEFVGSFSPAGSMSSTGTDMTKFARALLNGGEYQGQRFIGEDTLAEAFTQSFSHHESLAGMALGFYETMLNNQRVVGHGGDTMLFHTDLAIDIENDIAIFTSFTGEGGSNVRSAIVPAFYNRYFPVTETPPVPPSDFSERAARYAGAYQFWRSNFSTIEKILAFQPAAVVAPMESGTLMIEMMGGAKQYVEVDHNLFRELNSGLSLEPGIKPAYIAFQEDAGGNITGMVADGLPFMSMYKVPVYADFNLNMLLLVISLLVFISVLARLFYNRAAFSTLSRAERSATLAPAYVAAINLLFIVVAVVVIFSYGMELASGIPLAFKTMLVLPIIAVVATAYLAFQTYSVWRGELLASTWSRARYTGVTLCAFYMAWFYYFWNILGFQYRG